MNVGQAYIIASVNQSSLSNETNAKDHEKFKQTLTDRGIRFKEVDASFGGRQEKNLLLDVVEFASIEGELKAHNQNCLVLVYGDRYGELVDLTMSRIRPLGYMTQIEEPVISGNYFYDADTKRFFNFKIK